MKGYRERTTLLTLLFVFFQGDQKAQESVELSDDQEKDGICDQNQAGQHEVGLTEVPLLQDFERD